MNSAALLSRSISNSASMTPLSSDEELYHLLEPRVGQLHLKRRLGLESDREARIFGRGLNFFDLENWYSVHALIRYALRLTFLYRRAKRNALNIQVRYHEVRIPRLPIAFEGFTIMQLSDLHLDMNEEFPPALIERVRNLEYDLCVITGDFRYQTFGPCEPALSRMERVRPHLKDPVYGVLGNHDSIRSLSLGTRDLFISWASMIHITTGSIIWIVPARGSITTMFRSCSPIPRSFTSMQPMPVLI